MYEYKHPTPSAFTLTGPGGGDFHLHQGGTYELPGENAFIKALIDQGHLVLVKPTKSAKVAPTTTTTTTDLKEKI